MHAAEINPVKILPSILSADFSKLGEEVRAIVAAGADELHLDVMDGHFVPNISFGPDIVKSIRGATDRPFDVHLMISPVDSYLDAFAKAGANRIHVHAEAGPHLHRSLQHIRSLGLAAGVALNPATPIDAIEYVLDDIDCVLVMSVNPGFGGQRFIPATLMKIAAIKASIAGRDIAIEVDGGVDAGNAGDLARAGVTRFVAGSAVFRDGGAGYARNIDAIRRAAMIARGELI